MKVLLPSQFFYKNCATHLSSRSQFSATHPGCTWRCSKCVASWCFERTLKDWWRTKHTNLLNSDSLVCDFWCTCVFTFKLIHRLASILLLLLLCQNFLCQVGSAAGNPSGSLLGNRSRRPTWIYTGDDSSEEEGFANFLALVQTTKVTSPNQNHVKVHLQHQDQRSSLIHFFGNLLGPRILHTLGKK